MAITLHKFNNWLSVGIILLVGYVLVSPIAAKAELWLKQRNDPHHGFVYQSKVDPKPADNLLLRPIPDDNRLVIPQLQLDAALNEGKYYNTLNKGLWHRPGTGNPLSGGNTVVAGHRFTYKGASILYSLDKLKQGDVFIVYWQHKEYDYKITYITTVSPLDLSIEAPTTMPMFTIYTCTPLWTSKERLVIQAMPYQVKI